MTANGNAHADKGAIVGAMEGEFEGVPDADGGTWDAERVRDGVLDWAHTPDTTNESSTVRSIFLGCDWGGEGKRE